MLERPIVVVVLVVEQVVPMLTASRQLTLPLLPSLVALVTVVSAEAEQVAQPVTALVPTAKPVRTLTTPQPAQVVVEVEAMLDHQPAEQAGTTVLAVVVVVEATVLPELVPRASSSSPGEWGLVKLYSTFQLGRRILPICKTFSSRPYLYSPLPPPSPTSPPASSNGRSRRAHITQPTCGTGPSTACRC